MFFPYVVGAIADSSATATVTYAVVNGDLISDIGKIVSTVGTWFTTNPFLGLILSVGMVGLGIKLIKSIRNAIM